jgi:hypothetical protein
MVRTAIRRQLLANARLPQAGQSLAETAICAVLFFLLIFGILDFGRLLFTHLTLQHAMREAGRFAATGRHDSNPSDPTYTTSRTNAIFQVAKRAAVGLSLSSYQICSQYSGTNSGGGPCEMVTISLSQDLRLITPLVPMLGHFFGVTNFMNGGVYRATASATFRNEPFPPSQTN